MAELTREQMRERLGNIDHIRDIIVGPQLREYDNRLAQLESDLSILRQELSDRAEQLKTSLLTELRATADSLEKRIKSVSLTASEESADIRLNLERLNKKFSNTIEVLDNAIDKQTASLRHDLSETRTQLQEDARTLRNQIFEELDRNFSLLRDAKVSRDDVAEILFELGMRLKGAELVRQLKEAADNEVDGTLAILEINSTSEENHY